MPIFCLFSAYILHIFCIICTVFLFIFCIFLNIFLHILAYFGIFSAYHIFCIFSAYFWYIYAYLRRSPAAPARTAQFQFRRVRRLDVAEPAAESAPTLSFPGSGPFCRSYSSILYWEQWTMGSAGPSSTTGLVARSNLGNRGGGDSACWLSMVRRRTARGRGIGGGRGGGRGGDGDGVADKDALLPTALLCRRFSSANLNMC